MTSTLLAAAISGILVGATGALGTNQPANSIDSDSDSSVQELEEKGKHACKGQNACKGQGGCKTDKHACKGQNACKGQGGCKS